MANVINKFFVSTPHFTATLDDNVITRFCAQGHSLSVKIRKFDSLVCRTKIGIKGSLLARFIE